MNYFASDYWYLTA